MNKKSLYWLVLPIIAFGSWWRRWLGTGTDKTCHRIWKILLLYAFVLLCYFLLGLLGSVKDWICYAWVSTWFMAFWNMSHGDYFAVNDTSPDEARLKWVDWCLRLIYGKDNYYNFKGNVTGLFIRYTVPAVLCALFMPEWYFCFAGLIVAFDYGICGKMFPDKPYTEYAEYLAGGMCFGLFYLSLI